MTTFEEMVDDAVKKVNLPDELQYTLFSEMAKRTRYLLRKLDAKEVEDFIQACNVLSNGDIQVESGLLDVPLSIATLGDSLLGFIKKYEKDENEEKKMGALSVFTIVQHMRQMIELAKIYKKQRQTIESLTTALAFGREASNEA